MQYPKNLEAKFADLQNKLDLIYQRTDSNNHRIEKEYIPVVAEAVRTGKLILKKLADPKKINKYDGDCIRWLSTAKIILAEAEGDLKLPWNQVEEDS